MNQSEPYALTQRLKSLAQNWVTHHPQQCLNWFEQQRHLPSMPPPLLDQGRAVLKDLWELIHGNQPVLAMTWMANSSFTSGDAPRGAALMVLPGSPADQNPVADAASRLAEISLENPDTLTPDERTAVTMLEDEDFQGGRIRQLPLTVCNGASVWLADAILHRSMFSEGGVRELPLLPAFFNSKAPTPLFLLPFAFTLAAQAGSVEVPTEWRDAARAAARPAPTTPPKQNGCRRSVFILLGVLGIGFVALTVKSTLSSLQNLKSPGYAEFSEASSAITSSSGGAGQGNSLVTRRAAKAFADAIQLQREALFTKRKSYSLLGDGKFVVWCEENPHGVVFLVHVPDLRKYSLDAKETLGVLCFETAQIIVTEHFQEAKKVAVGLRGIIIFDRALIGAPTDPQATSVLTDTDVEAALIPFFVPKKPASAVR